MKMYQSGYMIVIVQVFYGLTLTLTQRPTTDTLLLWSVDTCRSPRDGAPLCMPYTIHYW